MACSRDRLRMAQVGAETLNLAHPGSRFSGGNLDTLKGKLDSKLLEALSAFYHAHYSANLMKAVIYSNKSLPEMTQIAANTFGRFAAFARPMKANLQKAGSSTDSALAALYVPLGYGEYQSMANSSMLMSQIVQLWFYNQLLTEEEQLGYAVFAFQMPVGPQWGISFLLQSNNKRPAYLLQRYQAFSLQAEKRLSAMSQSDFSSISR